MRVSMLSKLFLAAGSLMAALPMMASTIPYSGAGKVAPTTTTYATSSDGVGVSLYYFGASASYNDTIQVYDVQTGFLSDKILTNQGSKPGQTVTVGQNKINTGDQIVFYVDSPEGLFASDPAFSSDGVNHVYIAPYAGGVLNGTTVPAGLFLGLEDKKLSDSDLDYNDLELVATGVGVTPEPGSIALLGTGLLGVVGAMRRRSVTA